jgi:ABC-type sulfate/molybdate transport systems ATPase subunit
MATHNTDIVNNMLKRVITLEKGKLTQDSAKQNSDDNNTSVSHSTLKDELSGSNSISSAKVTAAGESDEREGNTEPIKEVESPKEEKEKKLDPKQIEEKMASLVEEFATEKPSETKNEHKSSHKHKVDEVKEEKKEEKD